MLRYENVEITLYHISDDISRNIQNNIDKFIIEKHMPSIKKDARRYLRELINLNHLTDKKYLTADAIHIPYDVVAFWNIPNLPEYIKIHSIFIPRFIINDIIMNDYSNIQEIVLPATVHDVSFKYLPVKLVNTHKSLFKYSQMPIEYGELSILHNTFIDTNHCNSKAYYNKNRLNTNAQYWNKYFNKNYKEELPKSDYEYPNGINYYHYDYLSNLHDKSITEFNDFIENTATYCKHIADIAHHSSSIIPNLHKIAYDFMWIRSSLVFIKDHWDILSSDSIAYELNKQANVIDDILKNIIIIAKYTDSMILPDPTIYPVILHHTMMEFVDYINIIINNDILVFHDFRNICNALACSCKYYIKK